MDFPRPLPVPTPTTEPFWNGLAEGQVRLQQCDDCDAWVFYPRSHCNACLSPNLTWKTVSGKGTIYSFTVARRPTAPQFADDIPQLIAVIELNEGVRLNSVMVNIDPTALAVGLAVKPVFHRQDGSTLLYFEPD
ncbi:MAG: OB-fold domain-containing protein [Proteobacteria bacterium]|jgi:uncharacterized OB-fold protein|nr:OB-fold domain-containing protein [Pseudomonadota bacterium]MDA1300411.1 OB-fold domain-containing protein [Pseudomonadota bacterium]